MKENEAPENIYLHMIPNKEIGSTWHDNKISDTYIEYTRANAFIKKAENYLYKQLNEGNMECGDIETFIEDFRKYMKGE